jgi:hypothetical protein
VPKVNGYKLRESLKVWELKKNAVNDVLANCFLRFPDEPQKFPEKASTQLEECELAIARLQTAQAYYNLNVQVTVGKQTFSMMEAVKLIGGAGRLEKIWRSATKGLNKDRHNRYEYSRNKDDVSAVLTLDPEKAIQIATEKARYAGQIRAAIAVGNGKEVEIEFLDPELLQ